MGSSDGKLRLWWCGWNVPFNIPPEDMLEDWPYDMQGWHTGEGNDYSTWTGAVWAETDSAATETVLSCYGASSDQITLRWPPRLQDDDFTPGDRFPDFTLKKPTGPPPEPINLWDHLQNE